jgi:hypothetical protein
MWVLLLIRSLPSRMCKRRWSLLQTKPCFHQPHSEDDVRRPSFPVEYNSVATAYRCTNRHSPALLTILSVVSHLRALYCGVVLSSKTSAWDTPRFTKRLRRETISVAAFTSSEQIGSGVGAGVGAGVFCFFFFFLLFFLFLFCFLVRRALVVVDGCW